MNEPNPLLPRTYRKSTNISIYSPAVTSSGDVYHIAAYYLLCDHYDWYKPKLFLAYDTEKTRLHADRASQFINILFRGEINCQVINVQTNTNHYPVRNKKALEKTLEQPSIDNNHELVINQKMLTSFIQTAFINFGHKSLSSILRYGFKNKTILKNEATQIRPWIASKIKETRETLNKKPFIVIHNRYSSETNDNQNLSSITINAIIKILKRNNIGAVVVNTSSGNCPVIKDTICINAFESIQHLNPIYCKFQHIILLSALSGIANFKGVIGGTSGTLDVIAFMGINVLNIHNFSTKKNAKFSPHQDFRIMLQSVFMSLCDNNINEDTIKFWLSIKNFLFSTGTIDLGLGASFDERVERIIFKYAYRPNGATSVLINPYYSAQKVILNKQSQLAECFNDRNSIKEQQQRKFKDITKEFEALKPR